MARVANPRLPAVAAPRAIGLRDRDGSLFVNERRPVCGSDHDFIVFRLRVVFDRANGDPMGTDSFRYSVLHRDERARAVRDGYVQRASTERRERGGGTSIVAAERERARADPVQALAQADESLQTAEGELHGAEMLFGSCVGGAKWGRDWLYDLRRVVDRARGPGRAITVAGDQRRSDDGTHKPPFRFDSQSFWKNARG